MTPEQGRQIVQHLDDLRRQLLKCLDKWQQPDDGFINLIELAKKEKVDLLTMRENTYDYLPRKARLREPDPQEREFTQDIVQLRKLSDQVKVQVEQGHIEKKLLIELNEKLGKIQANYGNILIFSATVAAIKTITATVAGKA